MENTYSKTVLEELNIVAPSKIVTIRPRDKPGMTGHVRRLFKNCHRAHNIALQDNTPECKENHRVAHRVAKNAWRLAQNHYYAQLRYKLACPGNQTKIHFKLLKSICGNKIISNTPTLKNEYEFAESNLDKATFLNDFFVEQSTLNLSQSNTPLLCEYNRQTGASLDTISVTTNEITQVLNKLKPGKATGHDGIGNSILSYCADV